MFSTIGYYICVPFAWLLRLFYNLTGSYGWALILFTLIVKIVLLPFQMKSKKSMLRMNRFQPKIKEIQTKYANNQAKMNEEMQLLYAEEGFNPMGGCLWSFLPFPIIIALYSIIRQPLSRFMLLKSDVIESIRALAESLGYVVQQTGGRASFYEEIHLAQFVSQNYDKFSGKFEGLFPLSYNFLGLDLTVVPQNVIKSITTGGWAVIGLILIPIISAVLSFIQSKVSMAASASANDAAGRSTRMMLWMMPVMSLWIGFTLPAALGVYWIANSFFMIIQEVILNKFYGESLEREETEREKMKREERVARMMAAREQQRQQQQNAPAKQQKKQPEKKTEKKNPAGRNSSVTTENGRIGERPYARGRSFSPDHYGE